MKRANRQIDPYDHIADLVRRLGGVNAAARFTGRDGGYISKMVHRQRPVSIAVMGELEDAVRQHERRPGCQKLPRLKVCSRRPKTCGGTGSAPVECTR